MDIADKAQNDMDYYASIRKVNTSREVNETGYCLNCGEPLPKGRRWCDSECRDEWEKHHKQSR